MSARLLAVADLDSRIFAHLASQDVAELARFFASAYLRLDSRRNSRNEVDAGVDFEAQCADMKREPDGTHACAAHASPTAREMTANERLDHAAETGEPVRCRRCDVDEPQPRRRREVAR